jgi:hypothetical protein
MTSVSAVLAAILFLAPQLGLMRADHLARIIAFEADMGQVDPLFVAAFIHVETSKSWRADIRSPTNDYGLCQVHVSAVSKPEFIGREELLFDPVVNVHAGVQVMRFWRDHHRRNCIWHGKRDHPWWAHLKWGYRVKTTDHARKVRNVYRVLRQRFGGVILAEVTS